MFWKAWTFQLLLCSILQPDTTVFSTTLERHSYSSVGTNTHKLNSLVSSHPRFKVINPWSLRYFISLSTSFRKHCGLRWCLLRISPCSLFLGGLNPSPPLHPPPHPPPSWLLYIFLHPCLPLINYKVSINKREQLFTCSAISLAKAIFILRPFIYHHSTLVRAIACHGEGDSN